MLYNSYMVLEKYCKLKKEGASCYLLIPHEWIVEQGLKDKNFTVTINVRGSSITVFAGKMKID